MSKKNISRVQFINSKLLGRKRTSVETVGDYHTEQDTIEIEPIMKKLETDTTLDREQVVKNCQELYNSCSFEKVTLQKQFHKMYLDYSFANPLPSQLKALDASQPWLLYWIGNSLAILDKEWLKEGYQRGILAKIVSISPTGGPFSGGLGQLPHLAATYAAINALALCNNVDEGWGFIDKQEIYQWLLSLKTPNGGFRTCAETGECDTRGVYCALSIASMLDIQTPELCKGSLDFLIKCQTYEGGFGGCPQEDEAHGGYTFCAVASLAILGALDRINVGKLMEWCSARQYNEEKGLSGRSNKLVDGCYSFWVGGTAAILEAYGYGTCINKQSLCQYILQCCQSEERPGLRDKPGAPPDFYHTNYVLLGLAVTKYSFRCSHSALKITCEPIQEPDVEPMNPVYGLPTAALDEFTNYFHGNS